ncbi:MAG: hypothetical protein UY34_C0006G0008 [Parcubacteria group bacterium GW2011_GWA2_48_9]|nr:MAG: hypothetical protein UY34_C0006G0008 [Parcubacteria group bacterium GW2011_GWA2_48_9]
MVRYGVNLVYYEYMKKQDDTSPPASSEETVADKKETRKLPVQSIPSDNSPANPPKAKFSVKRIAEIYADGGKPPDMSKIIRKDPLRKKKVFLIIIFILIVLFATSLAGLHFFNESQNQFSGDRVELAVQGSEQVASGEEIELRVVIKNGEHITLTGGELTVLYPANFRLSESEPEPLVDRTNVWGVDDLFSGDETAIVLHGSVIGEVGDDKLFAFTYSYVPESLGTDFEESVNFTMTITSSIINLDVEAPIRVGVGKETTFIITYRNESKEPLERVRIVATYPEGFSVIGSTPEADEGANTWEIAKLDSDQEGTITVRGTLSGLGGETKELKVQIGIIEGDATFRLQVESTSLILLLKPELSLTLSVDGSEAGGISSLGDLLSYTVAYVNNGDVEVRDVTITLTLSSDVLDWDKFIDPQNGNRNGATITWTKDQVQALESVKAGDGSEFTFSVPVHEDPFEVQEMKKNLSVTANARATSTKVTDLEGQSFETDSNTTVTKIATDLTFHSQARYYSDESLQVGYGPLPPVVGEKTTYRVYWNLSNTTNEISDVVVSTTLPETIIWTGTTSVSAGDQLLYDKKKHTVTWNVNRIPVGAGTLFAELEAYFDVAVNPVSADVGDILVLNETSTAKGTDSYTEEELSITNELLTTDLESDPQAKGKGIVTEATE